MRWLPRPKLACSGGQAILRTDSGYAAGSDPRKDGQAVGY